MRLLKLQFFYCRVQQQISSVKLELVSPQVSYNKGIQVIMNCNSEFSASGTIASIANIPFDVAKSRIQVRRDIKIMCMHHFIIFNNSNHDRALMSDNIRNLNT